MGTFLNPFFNSFTTKNTANIAIFAGNGYGGFTFVSNQVINPSKIFDNFQFEIADIVAADFDGDGKKDLAAANYINPFTDDWSGGNNYHLFMLTGDGTGNFKGADDNDRTNRALTVFNSQNYPGLLAVRKVYSQNQLVVSSFVDGNNAKIRIYDINSNGGLTIATTYDYDGLINDLKTADLNNDGVDEIIVNSNRLTVIAPIAVNGAVVRQLFEYDPNFGQLIKSTDEEDRVTTYDLNPANGDVLQIKRGTGGLNVTKFEYDGYGLVTKVIDPDKYFTSTTYDGFGRVLTVKQGNDNVPSTTTTISTLSYYLDNSGNVDKKTDSNGKTTEYTYQPNTNWIDRETYADGLGYTDYQYYADGLVKSVISSDGYGQEFTYDGLGKVLTAIDRTAQGNILRTNAYDLAGNLEDVISTVGSINQTTHYTYDSRNRLKRVDNLDGSHLEYEYYVGSPNTKTTDVDGTTTETTEYTYETTLNV